MDNTENKKSAKKQRISKKSKEFAEMSLERINRTKPWLKSTGPKTADGKAKVSQNKFLNGAKATHPLYLKQLVNQISISTAAILKEELEKYEAELAADQLSDPTSTTPIPSSDD